MLGIVAAALMAGAFLASPELRAYASTIANDVICTGCVGTTDLANNAVTAAKIKDGEVKAAEIATDAVGAAELQGVTKLQFGECVLTDAEKTKVVPAASTLLKTCNIAGVDDDDLAIATLNISFGGISSCFPMVYVVTESGHVNVIFKNTCPFEAAIGSAAGPIGILVYDK